MSIEDILRQMLERQQQNQDSNREPEPEISNDRVISPGPLHLCLVFKRCQHHHHIPTYILDGMSTHREKVEFINSRQCVTCIQEWHDMESSLNAEYHQFIRNGGKL